MYDLQNDQEYPLNNFYWSKTQTPDLIVRVKAPESIRNDTAEPLFNVTDIQLDDN